MHFKFQTNKEVQPLVRLGPNIKGHIYTESTHKDTPALMNMAMPGNWPAPGGELEVLRRELS